MSEEYELPAKEAPKSVWLNRWFELATPEPPEGPNIEYINADLLRVKLGGYKDSDLFSLAESLRVFHKNAEATMEEMHGRIAELAAAQRWVSVGERLPQDGDKVLGLYKSGGRFWRYALTYYFSEIGFWNNQVDILYWTPLLPPPQTQEDVS
jgi:hypothetical protein